MIGRVVVLEHAFVRSHPEHTERADALETSDLFTRGFATDVHFTAYSPATNPPQRLSHASLPLLGAPPVMRLLVVDVDGPNHGRTPQWDDDLRAKVACAPGEPFGYFTRGGGRLIWTIEPFSVERPETWTEFYLWCLVELAAVSGIVSDPTCRDWTRLFRAPHATRDGVLQTHGWICGHATRIGRWPGVELTVGERAAALAWVGAQAPAWKQCAHLLIEQEPAPHERREDDGEAALRWAVREVEQANKGQRNRRLYDVTRWVVAKANENDVRRDLGTAAKAAGLAPRETTRTIESAIRSAK